MLQLKLKTNGIPCAEGYQQSHIERECLESIEPEQVVIKKIVIWILILTRVQLRFKSLDLMKNLGNQMSAPFALACFFKCQNWRFQVTLEPREKSGHILVEKLCSPRGHMGPAWRRTKLWHKVMTMMKWERRRRRRRRPFMMMMSRSSNWSRRSRATSPESCHGHGCQLPPVGE